MATPSGGVYSVLDDERINGRADFFTGLGMGIDGSWAPQVGSLIPSNSETENYNWLGTVPQLQAWEGEAMGKELAQYSYTLTNVPYEATLRINKDDLRRDKTGQIRTRMTNLGFRAGTHWESLVSTLILNGEATTNGAAYDSQAFFDTDHAESGSNQTNDLTATEVPSANVTTAAAPTSSEMANVIVEAISHMQGLKDDQGEPVNGNANNWVIMGGTAALASAIHKAIGSELLDSGNSNPLMAFTRDTNVRVQGIHNPRLSANTTKVYLFNTDSTGDIGPFILQDEVGVGVVEDDPGPRSKNLYVMASATRAAGYGLWQKAALVTLS